MKNIFENECYAASWGVTCFYDDCERMLKNAFESGKPFEAIWGAKKELSYAKIQKTYDHCYVEVTYCIDSVEDAIDTLIWKAAGGNDICDSGWDWFKKNIKDDYEAYSSFVDEILDLLSDEYSEEFSAGETLPADAGYDQIIETLGKLDAITEHAAEDAWQGMVNTVNAYLAEFNGVEQSFDYFNRYIAGDR